LPRSYGGGGVVPASARSNSDSKHVRRRADHAASAQNTRRADAKEGGRDPEKRRRRRYHKGKRIHRLERAAGRRKKKKAEKGEHQGKSCRGREALRTECGRRDPSSSTPGREDTLPEAKKQKKGGSREGAKVRRAERGSEREHTPVYGLQSGKLRRGKTKKEKE